MTFSVAASLMAKSESFYFLVQPMKNVAFFMMLLYVSQGNCGRYK